MATLKVVKEARHQATTPPGCLPGGGPLQAQRRPRMAGRIQKWSPKAALNTGVLPNGMPCKYVSRNDLQFLHNEVYVKRTYLQHGIRLEPGDTVLDVGANIGFFAMQAAEVCGAGGLVVSVEPIPATCDALRHNVASHSEWRRSLGEQSPAPVTVINAGAGDGKETRAEFTFYRRAAGWSTMQPSPQGVLEDMRSFLDASLEDSSIGIPDSLMVRVGRFLRHRVPWLYRLAVRFSVWAMMLGKEVVQCKLTSISQILEEQQLRRISLLKVDVERAELSVLQGVDPQDWTRIDQIVMEVHDDGGGERLNTIKSMLKSAGFGSVVVTQDAALRGTRLFNLYCTKGGTGDT